MAKDKKEQRQQDEGSGILIPVLVAAMIFVLLATSFIVVYGMRYTEQQRAIAAQQSTAPSRSLPSSQEPSPSATPTEETPAEAESPGESAPEAENTSPSVSPSAAPSETPKPSEAQTPESQTPTPTPSNTTQTPEGNDRESKFANGMVLATTESDNNGNPVYHTSDCRAAQKIDTESELWYESEQAAKADRREICGICSR